MSEEADLERTEPASPRRLEKAREEGQVARSTEFTTFSVLAAGAAALWLTGGAMLDRLSGVVRAGLVFSPVELASGDALTTRLQDLAYAGLLAAAPLGLVIYLVAIVAPMSLSGWVFSTQLLAPNFTRLNPLNGIGRMFSTHSIAELCKALVKAGFIGGVGVWAVWVQKDALLGLANQSFEDAVIVIGRVTGLSLFALVGGLLAVAALDVPYQLWEHSRKLRMSREELRREAKETEGDPQIKARVRSLQRDAARKRMMTEVPKAAVVITNPTHYAVALAYREGANGAPRVVAKGTHLLAQRIRELAQEHQVPILEAPPLARALYKHVELDAEIPAALYNAVAEVLVYVFRLRRYFSYGGKAPQTPDALPVPAELDPGPDLQAAV